MSSINKETLPQKPNPETSIIIITLNQKHSLQKTIGKLKRQQYKDFEVIAVDSGSTDGSKEMLKKNRAQLINYRGKTGYKEFNFARAFNMGAKKSQGKYLVRLSGDVIPRDRYWLKNLLKPLKDQPKSTNTSNIAATYSRQYCDQDSDLHHKFLSFLVFSRYRNYLEKLAPGFMFWGASAAIRRDLWEKYPFSEKQRQGEDVHWGAMMATLGYKVVYCPRSRVQHDHHKKRAKAALAMMGSLGRFIKMYPPYASKMIVRRVRDITSF
jgi:glycosyltransferase involved in cell wall biosynthesis